MNTLILQFKKLTPLRLIVFALACFGLAPMAQAVGPDTDGTIPGSNNGEGIGVLVSRTTGIWNTGTGFDALNHLTAGNQNTATGLRALFSDIDGGYNTATGVYSLFSNTSGFFNSATGAYALANNISGTHNTANGYAALYRNTADDNTATGFAALYHNTTGTRHTAVGTGALQNCIAPPDFAGNTAVGTHALLNDTTGNFNTAIGDAALVSNTIGAVNTAIGLDALVSNTEGNTNTAVGGNALFNNTTGDDNTAVGIFALFQNDTGNFNTAVGRDALNFNVAGGSNTAVGRTALIFSTGDRNTALGDSAGTNVTTASNVTCIGANVAGANVSDTCFIGNITGTAVVGDPVVVNGNGQLGTVASAARFKKEIRPMDKSSEAILALKPVRFQYKSDSRGMPQFGLIAEEVAKVNPDLVVRDRKGEIYSVRYDAVNAMLLNEFLKEHRKVEQLEEQVEKLAAGLQKVSAELELSKPAPQTVLNNQ
jgi:hypothetical protein